MRVFHLFAIVILPILWSPAAGDQLEHGGGCRKSSPEGQCCHMDKKAGVVHCH